jgi:hypothetical protein
MHHHFGRVAAAAALVLLGMGPAVPAHAQPGQAAAKPSAPQPTFPPAYWLAAADGAVSPFGGAPFLGGADGAPLNKPVVGMAATPDGHGYWLVASDGGIFAFGAAGFHGSTGGLALNKPVVGMASTLDGTGYWLVASDGGIFAYGNAQFRGSTGGLRLNKPVVGMAANPFGGGYWLVASDGGVFAFGNAGYFGSTGGLALNKPVVGIAPTPDGGGYWLVASDGGIFAFGDAGYYGSTGGFKLNKPIVQMAATPSGFGYWLVASDGGIFTFGDAPFAGSLGSTPKKAPVVTMAATFNFGTYPPGAKGYDISWPQCGKTYPVNPSDFAIVGVNFGHAYSTNPCLGTEWAWAVGGGRFGAVYLNLNAPGGDGSPATPTDPYQFGYGAAVYSLTQAAAQGVTAITWWLDVETKNTWFADQGLNSQVIQGALDALHAAGKSVGVYCTPYQWGIITGGYLLGVPVWAAGSPPSDPGSFCNPTKSVGGGPVWLVQYTIEPQDYDLAC